jgi:hypothetical protein
MQKNNTCGQQPLGQIISQNRSGVPTAGTFCHSRKAIVATARELLEFIYFTLVNDIVGEDSNTGTVISRKLVKEKNGF